MLRIGRIPLLTSLTLALCAADPRVGATAGSAGADRPGHRRLTFDQRVEAQAAIERVYHAHRIGATRPFAEAAPRALLERKVRTYLAQSVALESTKNPITAAALRGELERIAAETRLPDRLQEIYAALGRDSYLLQETFARAALAGRLAGDLDVEGRFDPSAARDVAEDLPALPVPAAASVAAGPASAADCAIQDVWSGAPDASGAPSPRAGQTAVWTGSEMIVWGGQTPDGTAFLDTGARYDPLTDSWHATTRTGAPSGRKGHQAVWTGSDMIVWGGGVSGTLFTTGGRYDPGADAWVATSTVGAPPGLSFATAVWTGHQMIVWGSAFGTPAGGRYDPATDSWSSVSGIGAPLAQNSAAVWSGTEMIAWGGSASPGAAYNPSTDSWRALSAVNAPAQRLLPLAVWTGSEMIVWGGFSGGFAPGGGRYDPATDTWKPTGTAGQPLNRYNGAAVWTGGRMIVWGGTDFSHSPPNSAVNTGGIYDPAADSWTATSLTGAPGPRAGISAVWTGSRMIVWGGGSDSSGGRYDPSANAWAPTNVVPGSPSPRRGHTAVWTGSEMIVWGGTTDASGGRFDPLLDSWSPTSLQGAPLFRAGHTAVWTGQSMVVWGGYTSSSFGTPVATGGRYDPVADAWSPTTTSGAPTARGDHTAVWTGTRMIVWGGGGAGLDTGGVYDPSLDAWTPTSTTGAPTARMDHTAVWTGSRMIVWGGFAGGGVGQGDGGSYDPAADAWTPIALAGAPVARAGHTAVWTGSEMIVWGGSNGSSLGTGGRYDPAADAWTPTAIASAPSPRVAHTAVWTGREMIVWGGDVEVGFPPSANSTNTGGRYDPAADAWTATTQVGAAGAREKHTAVWTGTAMIVRGGEVDTGDVILLAPDPFTAWYGAASAAPSPDADHDGVAVCAGDCDDANPDVWGTPSEVTGLALKGGVVAVLSWDVVTTGGAARYDVLRSTRPDDFESAAICVATDEPDTTASDSDVPAARGVFYYLVRAVNACPVPLGIGPLGAASNGTPRQGRVCP